VIAPAHVGKLAKAAINDYSPQFPLRLMNKDFQLILTAAAHEHVHMPATEAAFYVNADELANDELAQNEEQDFSAVLRRMEDLADISPIPSVPMTS
jgi:3-hydroxyisobutyrate dehydrogenase-like beta-hydroxyacid dehydrogenase